MTKNSESFKSILDLLHIFYTLFTIQPFFLRFIGKYALISSSIFYICINPLCPFRPLFFPDDKKELPETPRRSVPKMVFLGTDRRQLLRQPFFFWIN